MNETVHINPRNNKHQNTFGGVIYASDFNTGCKGDNYESYSSICRRIISDAVFDSWCSRQKTSTLRYRERYFRN